ncbi:MAG: hypothetical protein KJP21_00010 [Bacteroidia bacterium]|nr:hypothetical protein [Bacteroidia bacterium]NNJ56477.1 hypothetical protein [Bacteroidia bacterium]
MKKVSKLIILFVFIAALITFFESMKIEPEDYTSCEVSTIECADPSFHEKTHVDTASIVQEAVDRKRKELEDEFLSEMTGRRLWGIDISKYQKNINWSLMVRKNKPDFVFVKVTEGTTIVDKMYRSHKRNLEKHDVLHGAYHFMSFSSSGRNQALKFIRHAKLKKGNMVPVLDVEYTKRRMPSKRKVIREIRSFCRTIEQHYGVKPIIYTHPHLYAKYLKNNFRDYPLWLCDYRNSPRYKWAIWQHTSKARLYGYKGRLDKNVMKSDKKTLKKLVML